MLVTPLFNVFQPTTKTSILHCLHIWKLFWHSDNDYVFINTDSSESSCSADDSDARHSRSTIQGSTRSASEVGVGEHAIMGSDPKASEKLDPPLHAELVNRWETYVKQGIDKDKLKKIIDNYSIPENCTQLAAPQLNPEIQNNLADSENKSDTYIAKIQMQIASSLSGFSQPLSTFVNEEQEKNKELIMLSRTRQKY